MSEKPPFQFGLGALMVLVTGVAVIMALPSPVRETILPLWPATWILASGVVGDILEQRRIKRRGSAGETICQLKS